MVAMVASDFGWSKISDWLDADDPISFYSDFGWGEAQSAMGNRVRRGEFPAQYAHDLLADFKVYLTQWTFIRVTSSDIDAGTDMVTHFSLGLRLPDAIHVAIAARMNATLISTDIRQIRAAMKLGIAAINPTNTDGN